MAGSFLSGRSGFFSEIAGEQKPGRMTIESVVEMMPAAAISVGVNNAGGMLAGTVHAWFDGYKAGWGALGVELVAVVLKAVFQPTSNLNLILRELASGMAGAVGSEIVGTLMLWFKAKDWSGASAYKRGDVVKYQDAYWEAAQDGLTGSPPGGPTGGWNRLRAQGTQATQWPALAQAFLSNPGMGKSVSEMVAKVTADKTGMTEEDRATLASDIQQALQTFAQVVYDNA